MHIMANKAGHHSRGSMGIHNLAQAPVPILRVRTLTMMLSHKKRESQKASSASFLGRQVVQVPDPTDILNREVTVCKLMATLAMVLPLMVGTMAAKRLTVNLDTTPNTNKCMAAPEWAGNREAWVPVAQLRWVLVAVCLEEPYWVLLLQMTVATLILRTIIMMMQAILTVVGILMVEISKGKCTLELFYILLQDIHLGVWTTC